MYKLDISPIYVVTSYVIVQPVSCTMTTVT